MEAQNPTALHAELPALLPEWLPQQRWFAARGRSVASVEVAAHTPLVTDGDPLLDLVLLAVEFADGRAARCRAGSWSTSPSATSTG